MFAKLSYSWELMGASWNVLKRDKHLIFFPLMSGICCLIVIASFVIPAVAYGLHHPAATTTTRQPHDNHVLHYALAFAFYFANYFVITFFNVGITAFAVSRMAGGEPSFGGALREALKRIHLIAAWALVAATVGLVLRAVSERSGAVGKIIVALVGGAWSLMTFLVVPVLVVEGKDPFSAIKASTALLKQTWGEQVSGNFSFGLIFFLLTLPAFAAFVIGGMIATATPPLGLTIIGAAVVYLILLSLVHSALVSIFQAAVYMYTQGVTDNQRGFPVQLLRSAMR